MAMINGWYVRPGKLTARRDGISLRATTARWKDYTNGLEDLYQREDGEPPPEAPGILVSGFRGGIREIFYFIIIAAPGRDETEILEEFANRYTPEYAAARAERRALAEDAQWQLAGGVATTTIEGTSLRLSRTTFGEFSQDAWLTPIGTSAPLPELTPERTGFLLVATLPDGTELPAWLNDDKDWLNYDTVEELTAAVSPIQLYTSIVGASAAALDPERASSQPREETVNGWQIKNEVASRKGKTMNYRIWEEARLPDGSIMMAVELTTPGVKTSQLHVKSPPEHGVANLRDFLRSEACEAMMR